jgi:hypothetical protein
VLALKANQPQMLDDVRLWLEHPPTSAPVASLETVDKGQGRIEVRRYWPSEVLGLPVQDEWRGLKSVGKVEATR